MHVKTSLKATKISIHYISSSAIVCLLYGSLLFLSVKLFGFVCPICLASMRCSHLWPFLFMVMGNFAASSSSNGAVMTMCIYPVMTAVFAPVFTYLESDPRN
jgi:hypothetical protein